VKLKSILFALTLFNATVLAGQAKQKAPAPKTGTLIVYRQNSFAGVGIGRLEFNVNHGPNMYVKMGRYQKLELPVGNYVLDHNYSFALAAYAGRDPQTVTIEAGKTAYFQCTVASGFVFEVADDQAQAARTVAKLKPMD
jgi:hypothetical protein